MKQQRTYNIHHISTYWHSCDRVTFVTDDFHGTIHVEYPKDTPDVGFIWQLWVDEGYRRKGYATRLLKAAEEHIALQGRSKAVLEWDSRDTPLAIYRWYERQGYNETEFGHYGARLEKNLTAKQNSKSN